MLLRLAHALIDGPALTEHLVVTLTPRTHHHQSVAHIQRVDDLRPLGEHRELALALLRDAPVHTADLLAVHVREVLVEAGGGGVHALQDADLARARDEEDGDLVGVAEGREVRLVRREDGGLREGEMIHVQAFDGGVNARVDPVRVVVDFVVILQV